MPLREWFDEFCSLEVFCWVVFEFFEGFLRKLMLLFLKVCWLFWLFKCWCSCLSFCVLIFEESVLILMFRQIVSGVLKIP